MKTVMRVTYGCILLTAGFCWSQDAAKPVEATLCDLYQHPEQYAGKMVRVRGGSVSELSIENILHDSPVEPCPTYMRIIVVFPDQIKPAPGFQLVRDEAYKKLEEALHDQSASMQLMKAASMRHLLGVITSGSGLVRTRKKATAKNINMMLE